MSTNYYNTLITISEDSPTSQSIVPDLTRSSVASQQYTWITERPYELTSDDVIFMRVAEKLGIPEAERASEQEAWFETGRACLRTSPLAKQHGWGIHADANGRIALIAVESDQYRDLVADENVKKVRAMKRSR